MVGSPQHENDCSKCSTTLNPTMESICLGDLNLWRTVSGLQRCLNLSRCSFVWLSLQPPQVTRYWPCRSKQYICKGLQGAFRGRALGPQAPQDAVSFSLPFSPLVARTPGKTLEPQQLCAKNGKNRNGVSCPGSWSLYRAALPTPDCSFPDAFYKKE